MTEASDLDLHVVSTAPADEFGAAEYLQSTFYEQLVEHLFVAELLQETWFRHKKVVEVLRSEIDASGFDLVLECNGILRHVQLKTSRVTAKTNYQKVAVRLGEKPGGCVIWILRDEVTNYRLRLSYLFFGFPAGESLPSLNAYKVAKHTKGDSTGIKKERPGIRQVPKKEFQPIKSTGQRSDVFNIAELLYWLFGLADDESV
jgi:hypothetical protein